VKPRKITEGGGGGEKVKNHWLRWCSAKCHHSKPEWTRE